MFLIQEKGGACIAITKSFILIGTFNTEKKMSNGVPQGPGEANKRVELLAKDLISKGYWLFASMNYQSIYASININFVNV